MAVTSMPAIDLLEVRCSFCQEHMGYKPAEGLVLRPWMEAITWGICSPCETSIRASNGLPPKAVR